MHIARLYRFPVKGMTPEPRQRLVLQQGGTVEGDRVLGFIRQAVAQTPERQVAGLPWWRKQNFAVLMNLPEIARVRVSYDDVEHRLRLAFDGRVVEGCVDLLADRERLAVAVSEFVQAFERPPSGWERGDCARLMGDGVNAAFADRGPHYVTLVGSASVAALGEVLGAQVDERRFRMNAIIDGLEPWAELDWMGRAVRIGEVELDITGPVIRCLATHVNPETGQRDLEVLPALTRKLGQEKPTVGVLAVPRTAGAIAIGDEVVLLA